MKTMSPWLEEHCQKTLRYFYVTQAYPNPICETLCLAISFSSLISPPAGWFDKVKVLKSTVAGRTSDSCLLSAQNSYSSRADQTFSPSRANVSAGSTVMRTIPSGPRKRSNMMFVKSGCDANDAVK
jgi:hypothetical protein